ncbi:MAG TPA: cytochrome c3 family protein [Gemmatimonadales bacterium]|jgi:Cytochrome c7 and related cytochrome c/Class III cytochrome C family|nr:cytochrome c3 family protein [Gemmatimonadales bacterium]
MRKPVLITLGAGAAAIGLAALAITSGRTGAQAPKSVADSLKAPVLAAGDTSALRGPRQPIFFRHDIHAGQFKIQCQYCHYSVAVSSEPGIPSMQTCMGCHNVIAGTDSSHKVEIKKLRDASSQKKPIEWTRVHFVARHVHFPHMRHIQVLGPNACQTCHGDVARMPQVYKVNNVNNMGFCITCHEQRGVTRDCAVCHY